MATFKNTSVNDTGYLQYPMGTTAQRPSSPAEGYTRFNTDTNYIEIYTQGSWSGAIKIGYLTATGGTITTSGNYKIHTFTSSGSFLVESAPFGSTIEVLIVGGGASGGSYTGGGGGGEVIYCASVTVVAAAYPIVIGAGGTDPGNGPNINIPPGNQTTAFGETAKPGGGGIGSDYYGVTTLRNRIANGGGGGSRTSGYQGQTGTNVYNTFTRYGGYTGGTGQNGGNFPTGGGAGAGGNGASPPNNVSSAGNGGTGVQINIDGNNYYWGGGGGGMIYYYYAAGTNGGNGGAGGGGAGWGESSRFGTGGTGGLNLGGSASGLNGGAGGANTGGGGGSGAGNGSSSPYTTGGNGGSGVVIVKYRYQ